MASSDQIPGKQPSAATSGSFGSERLGVTSTFDVADVTPASEPLPVIPYYQAASEFLGGQVEACSQSHGQLVADVRIHPLLAALHLAFATHRPICLSPDMVWLTLTQGLAYHINSNAEQLRHHFIRHKSKVNIVVRRDDFIKGFPENPWQEVFGEFSAAIHDHIGDAYDLIVADFSTTGAVERAASEIVLLDAMQAYFSYELVSVCGIPTITLEGTPADWHAIARRVGEFSHYGLDWWVAALEPLLEQFVAAASGKIDREFWDSIYKWHGSEGSGDSPFVSGWILKFFPYLSPTTKWEPDSLGGSAANYCRNPWMDRPLSFGNGPAPDRFPHLPARAPFRWNCRQMSYHMEFVGGLIGIRQDASTLCLCPEIGWVVWETGAEERKRRADSIAYETQRRAESEAAERIVSARNADAKAGFSAARSLGLQIHQLYVAASHPDRSVSSLDDGEQNRLLLELVTKSYEASMEFRRSWDAVHDQPPAACHSKWLSLWKRV